MVGGIALISTFIFFAYRFVKKSRASDRTSVWPLPAPPPSPTTFRKPSLWVRFLGHVPLLKSRFADRSWFNIDEPYAELSTEKSREIRTVEVQMAPRLDSQFFDPDQPFGVAIRKEMEDRSQGTVVVSSNNAPLKHSNHDWKRHSAASSMTEWFRRDDDRESLGTSFDDDSVLISPQQAPGGLCPPSRTHRPGDALYTVTAEDYPPRFRPGVPIVR